MPHGSVIDDYVRSLARALAFDRALARRVCAEVEDHLREAAGAERTADEREAERRAVERFGEPARIAAELAAPALARHARRLAVAAVVVIAAAFAAMRARLAWYAATTASPAAHVTSAAAAVVAIDRYAFWTAVVLGIAGAAFVLTHRVPPAFDARYRRTLRRFVLLSVAAASALIVSVIADATLTAMRAAARHTAPHAVPGVPLVTVAIEILCVAMLAGGIGAMRSRTVSAAESLPG